MKKGEAGGLVGKMRLDDVPTLPWTSYMQLEPSGRTSQFCKKRVEIKKRPILFPEKILCPNFTALVLAYFIKKQKYGLEHTYWKGLLTCDDSKGI